MNPTASRVGWLAVAWLMAVVDSFVTGAEPRSRDERLVVFVRPVGSTVAAAFEREQLPGISEIAENLGLGFRVVDVAAGAPAEVGLTPLIMYQNERGRSFYYGRLTTLDRIVNFVRTSRVVAQGDAALVREDIPVLQRGRVRVGAPIKISSVTGKPPKGYDDNAMRREATKAIAKGLSQFKLHPSAAFGRSDRLFYMDFYPWVSDDGTLFLSTALYSQFHCKEPIYRSPGEAVSGPWEDRGKLFQRAAGMLENAALKAMDDPTNGDGFDAVPSDLTTVSWESLGLGLIARGAEAGKDPDATGPPLPLHWTMAPPQPADPPLIAFRFPAPLDGYSGEVKRADGFIDLASPNSLKGASALFSADPTSITMGERDLDHALQGATYLHSASFPSSRFTLETLGGESLNLAYGRQSHLVMTGVFEMKGVRVPLTAQGTFEPIVADDGAPRLTLMAGFSLDLRPFNIPGPDGPEPASHTLQFDVAFTFQPKPYRLRQ